MEKLPFKVVGSTRCGLYVDFDGKKAWISSKNLAELMMRPDAKYELLPNIMRDCSYIVGVYRLETI
jgi:hypothetical protein